MVIFSKSYCPFCKVNLQFHRVNIQTDLSSVFLVILHHHIILQKAKAALFSLVPESSVFVIEVSRCQPIVNRASLCLCWFSDWYVQTCVNVRPLWLQLDLRDDGNVIQDALAKVTGRRSVPQVFIGGKIQFEEPSSFLLCIALPCQIQASGGSNEQVPFPCNFKLITWRLASLTISAMYRWLCL